MVMQEGGFALTRRLVEAAERQVEILREIRQGKNHSASFEPMFQVGDTVHVIKSDGEENIIIDGVDALPTYRHDFGTLSSSSDLTKEVTKLEMDNGEMAQFRFVPVTAFEVSISHPSGTVRMWRAKSQNFRLPPYLTEEYPPLRDFFFAASQFWVYEDTTPAFDLFRIAHNVEAYADFWGWRYHFLKLANQKGEKLLRVNGWPSGR